MNRKTKNTLVLAVLLVLILLGGGIYIFFVQRSAINEKQEKVKELKANSYNTEQLTLQLRNLLVRASELDSILASRKFNIPMGLSSIKFFDFVTNVSYGYSPLTQIDVEYLDRGQDREFFYFEYKVSGRGEFSDVYKLIYAIEESKELKKVSNTSISNLIVTDDEGIPHFVVSYNFNVRVYFSNDDRFATSVVKENELSTGVLYNAFYPLIRNEIPPNVDNLLDVQGAKLLALIPEGAFLADAQGNTYLLWEGEQVYLGYLTSIDYENSRVSFILNKGGIIEKVVLTLEDEEEKPEVTP